MVARESICRRAHPWSRLISRRSTRSRSKITTGCVSFDGRSVRNTLPEALLNSEIASATWLFVGGLFPAAMMMLSGTSNGVAASAGAAGAGRSAFAAFAPPEAVRSEAIFGGRSAEAAAVDRSSIADAVSRGFVELEARMGAGAFTAVRISAFATLYR